MKKAAYEKPAVQKINLTSTERITSCSTQMTATVGSVLRNNPGGDVIGMRENMTTFDGLGDS